MAIIDAALAKKLSNYRKPPRAIYKTPIRAIVVTIIRGQKLADQDRRQSVAIDHNRINGMG